MGWGAQASNNDRPHVFADVAILDIGVSDAISNSKRARVIRQTIASAANDFQGVSK
jgi:hypothetical protein